MSKIASIFRRLRGERASSNRWELSRDPRASDEAYFFSKHPESLINPGSSIRDRLHNLNYLLDIRAKKSFARFTYWASGIWISYLFLVVILQGFGGRSSATLELIGVRRWYLSFYLTEAEFIAFITTTTATIFGLSYLVGKYLFGQTAKKSDYDNPESSDKPDQSLNPAADPPVSPVAASPPAPPTAEEVRQQETTAPVTDAAASTPSKSG